MTFENVIGGRGFRPRESQKGIKMLRIAFPCFCLVIAVSLAGCSKSSLPLGFGYGTSSTGKVSTNVRKGLLKDLKARRQARLKKAAEDKAAKDKTSKSAAASTAPVMKAPAKPAPAKMVRKPAAKPAPAKMVRKPAAKPAPAKMAGKYMAKPAPAMAAKMAAAKVAAPAKPIMVKTMHKAEPVKTARLDLKAAAPKAPKVVPTGSAPRIDIIAARDMVNKYRKSKGLKPIELHPQLSKAAAKHSQDLARLDKITHFGSDGSNPWQRVERTGYKPKLAAENVGTGQKDFSEVMKGWKASPSHNENLLLPDASHMGIALVHNGKSKNKTFWTLILGTSL